MLYQAAQLKVIFSLFFVLQFGKTAFHFSRREIPAAGLPSGAAQVTGDEAGEAERDLRLLHGQDVRGAGQHQLLLQLPALLLPDVPEQLPESLLRHAAAAVHGGVLLLQSGLRGALRQVGGAGLHTDQAPLQIFI